MAPTLLTYIVALNSPQCLWLLPDSLVCQVRFEVMNTCVISFATMTDTNRKQPTEWWMCLSDMLYYSGVGSW